MRTLTAAVVLFAALLLNSCSELAKFYPFNNTDRHVNLILTQDALSPWFKAKEFLPYSWPLNETTGSGAAPDVAGSPTVCTLTLRWTDVAARISAEEAISGPIAKYGAFPVQLEPDLELYFLPRKTAMPARKEDIEIARAGGKFVHPSRANCGDPATP